MRFGLSSTARASADKPVRSSATADGGEVTVWVAWIGDEAGLRKAIGPLAVWDQFTLREASAETGVSGEWRCRFEYFGRGPEREPLTLRLLQRISALAPWRRVERERFAPRDPEVVADLSWDRLGRPIREKQHS